MKRQDNGDRDRIRTVDDCAGSQTIDCRTLGPLGKLEDTQGVARPHVLRQHDDIAEFSAPLIACRMLLGMVGWLERDGEMY